MELYNKLNKVVGWIVFAIATLVYFLTIEPTASWWDCGEYIATAYKLQVGHPPGAPLFQMIGRFFSLFAFGDTSQVALMVNVMSALSSSFTILFLFWTITHFGRKIALRNGGELTEANTYAIIASGVVGGLAFTFSDSFWFSAVEGEVYAMSSLFTAATFWAILRWEREEDRYANRWILLIAYIIGLSIGVHLLNLLAIPAITYVYYFKKYKPTTRGVIITGVVSVIILGVIQNGIIPWIVKLSSYFELAFVNGFGLPFNSGTIVYFLLLIGGIVFGLRYTRLKQKVIFNTLILSFAFILIGYSSFFMIIIRSNANPPIDENNPEDAISLFGYLAREQYGSWPILHGQYYNAPTIDVEDGRPIYVKDREKGRYVVTDDRKGTIPVYDPRFTTIFPRMWSNQKPGHVQIYKEYGKVRGRPVEVMTDDGSSEIRNVPTFGENLRFFFTYQLGHMYFRYFMWNFSGRQNDIESQGEVEHGNWLTGINWFDEHILNLGPRDNLPDSMQSKAYNRFYMLPFLLGLMGLFFHLNSRKRDMLVVALLFLMTGIAIIIYLNQYPYQPRERDYAYAGSFYAFSIWIGLGVMALFDILQKRLNPKIAALTAGLAALLLVPVVMAKDGWDDHDRSNKYSARDFAINYLNSCEPNAILFTNGDNDTFPLWYAQEVEGIRTDVRVVNFMLASGHWYIHQMMNKAYESEPLPFTLNYDQYENGVNNAVVFYDRGLKGYTDLEQIINFIASEDERSKLTLTSGNKINFSPTKKFRLIIDSTDVVNKGAVPEYMQDRIVDKIEWNVRQNYLYKNDLMLLDIIASNNWERPIYFANPSSISKVLGVEEYCHLEGMVYRFLPVKAEHYIEGVGGVNGEKSYELYLNTFKWGNLKEPGVYVDRESMRNSIIPKQNYMRVAKTMVSKGEDEKAVALLDRCLEEFPDEKIPYDMYMIPFIEVYYDAGAPEKAAMISRRVFEIYDQNMNYYYRLSDRLAKYYEQEYNQTLGVMQQLSMMARMNQQNDLYEEFDSVFTEHLQFME